MSNLHALRYIFGERTREADMDDYDESDYQKRRETTLAIMLSAIGLAGFLFFLVMISGGFFLWVYLIVGGIAFLGYINYLVWGRRMNEQTAGEREEAELRAQMEDGDWPDAYPRQRRHE